jgi:ferredoxin
MKVKADYDLCEANALCEAFAPEVFEVDDDDNLQLLTDQVTPDNEAAVRQAVAACPKAALSIVEE